MTHKSKVDVYILAAMLLAVFVFLMGDYWIAGPVLLVLALCAYPQSYQTTPRGLVVRTVLSKAVIPYETISYVGPASEERSSFSLTPEGVRIRYGLASEILISPADPRSFFADMAKRAPHLVKRGQKLVAVFA
jgi:hypothetical protein